MKFNKFFVLIFCLLSLSFYSCQTTKETHISKIVIKKPIKIVPKKEINSQIFDNKHSKELFFSANEFFDAKKYDTALNIYQNIINQNRKFSEIGFCFFNSGLIFQKRGNYVKAADNFEKAALLMKRPSDKKDAIFLEIESLRFLNRWKDIEKIATETMNNFSTELNEESENELKLYLAESKIMQGNDKEGMQLAEFVLFSEKRGKTRDELLYNSTYAMAEFVIGRDSTYKFKNEPLKNNIKSLESKCRFILEAQKHYIKTIRAGVIFWTNAAAYEIADLYLSLYDEMSAFPVPKTLNEEEKKIYKCELWKKTENLLKKSRRILKKSLKISQNLDLENDYTKQSFEKIIEINSIYDKRIQECKVIIKNN